ncbi:MAG: hypothetical protein ACQEVA_17725 [Myxococcota bacterium]
MIGWLTAGAIVVIAGAIVWLSRLYSRLGRRDDVVEDTRDILQKIGGALGIERYEERSLFGTRIHRLRGEFNDIDVDLEVQVAASASYLRLTLAFPTSLGHDFRVMSPRALGFWNWMLKLEEREFEMDEHPPYRLLARENSRVDQMLNNAVVFQIGRMLTKVDDLRIGDETMYVMCRRVPQPDELKSVVTKALDVAERIYVTAGQIGPAQSKVDASIYEEATTGMFQRVESDTMQSSGGTGRFALDTSKNTSASGSQKNESV